MSQPPPYNRNASFSNLQALNPDGQPPGNTMDVEFNAIKTTLDATLVDLALIQNDDGTVKNQSIGPAQLSAQLTLGFNSPRTWVTATAYTASPASTVLQGTGLYICLVSHTSGVFATDLAAGKWLKVLDLSTLTFGTASQIAVSMYGTSVRTDVQTSLDNLDDNKAATSHTHTAAQISDSGAAGRAMLQAATVSTQQTLLGLKALAFLDTLNVTQLPLQVGFTAVLAPTILAADINDYTPTGWSAATTFIQLSSANVVITGFGATTDGDFKFFTNIGNFNITLAANSTASALANRIRIPAPIILRPQQSVTMRYYNIGGYTGWSVLSPVPSAPPVGTARNLRMGNVANGLGDAAPVTPNNQVYIYADDAILKDATGASWAAAVSIATVDGTSANQANGTDGAYSIGASAWYSIWVIGNTATSTIAGLISTSATAPTLPTGYTFKARVGWMRTDGSSHFLKILQMGRKVRYTGTMPTIATGNDAGSDKSIVNFVPVTAPAIAVVAFGSVPAGTSVSVAATSTTSPVAVQVTNATGGGTLVAQAVSELLLEATTVRYVSTAGVGPGVACYGWEDS